MLRTTRTMSYGNANEEYRILVIGKSGNGKSTLCNAILGDNQFAMGRGMSATTRTAECATTFKGNMKLKVIDTPDITNCGMNAAQMREEVSKWRLLTMSRPSAVVLTVRCDVRYTAEEHAIYREIVKLWGDNSIKDNLVVAFTFADRQDMPIQEELKTVCPELKNVLGDARQSYFLFDKTSEQSRSGIAYAVIDAVLKRNTRGREPPSMGGFLPWPSSSLSTRILVALVLLLVIVAICCIVFIVLGIVGAAIAFGVIGIVLVVALLVLFYGKKKNRTLL